MLPLNNPNSPSTDLLRISQAAVLLGVHTNTLRNWEKQGKISTVRIGHRSDRRFRHSEILKLLSPKTANPAAFPDLSGSPEQLLRIAQDQFISLGQAATLTGYHEDYLGQRARLGQLKAVKIGRNWITHRSCLDDFSKTHPGAYPHRPKRLKRRNKSKIRTAILPGATNPNASPSTTPASTATALSPAPVSTTAAPTLPTDPGTS